MGRVWIVSALRATPPLWFCPRAFSSHAPAGGPSPTLFKISASETRRVAVLAPARARRAAAMTIRTGPTLGQRRKGRGTPLAVVSFPRVLAAARGACRRSRGRATSSGPLHRGVDCDGSASSRELCAGTSSAVRAQATVRLALQRETQGRRPRGTCTH
jgi:hypothetical protein